MTAARVRPAIRSKIGIPLFAEKPSHPFVPLGDQTAGARSKGQGRPSAGACALPLTAASTLAGWRQSGDRPAWHYAVLLLAGALSVCAGSGVAVAQSAPVERPAAVHPYAAHIAEASQRFGIPEHWIRAVLRAESAGDVRAVSSAGAMGLMQVMPDTWAGLHVRHGLGHDPYDPRDNILAGAAYLREMFDRYRTIPAMLGAYNAGPGRYDEYVQTGRALPAETRAYIALLAPQLGAPSPASASSVAPPPPPDWREAPLFVVRSADARSATSPSESARSNDSRSSVAARTPDTAEDSNAPIVVARSDGGTPR